MKALPLARRTAVESLTKSSDHRTDVCGLRHELPPTSGDLTWTFSLQELSPFPTAFGGGDGMLL